MAPRSRTKPSASGQRAPVEEEIDISNVSDTSEGEDNDTPGPAKARATPADAPRDEMTLVNSIILPVAKSNRAVDIDLLFERGKGLESVCKYCK